jgi:hypothetical protein
MKKAGFIISILIVLISCNNRNKGGIGNSSSNDSTSAPYMYFKQETLELGKVKQGDTVFSVFVVENRGKSDLIIKRVSPSCGCTVATYEEKPIPPFKSGVIKLIFATNGRSGKVTKNATVYSNAKPETKILTFKCEIESPNNKSK